MSSLKKGQWKRLWSFLSFVFEGRISYIRAACNYHTRNANFKSRISDIQLQSVSFLVSQILCHILKYTATPYLKNEGVHYLIQIITNKCTCNMHLFPFFHIINLFSKSVLLNNNKTSVLNNQIIKYNILLLKRCYSSQAKQAKLRESEMNIYRRFSRRLSYRSSRPMFNERVA